MITFIYFIYLSIRVVLDTDFEARYLPGTWIYKFQKVGYRYPAGYLVAVKTGYGLSGVTYIYGFPLTLIQILDG